MTLEEDFWPMRLLLVSQELQPIEVKPRFDSP